MCSPSGSEHVHVETHFQVHKQDVVCRQWRLSAYDEDLIVNSRTEDRSTAKDQPPREHADREWRRAGRTLICGEVSFGVVFWCDEAT